MSRDLLLIFCVLTIRQHLLMKRFERNGRGQEPSRGHKFSILENLVFRRDFTSSMRLHCRSDLVGVALVGATPLHLLSQTALPLKSPTGAFIAALRFANAVQPQTLLRMPKTFTTWTQEIIKNFISHVTSSDEKNWIVFVDTNPSFSIYTQLAVSGSERLIVPINADDSSKTAASAMVALLHGTNPPHPIYGSWTYAKRAQEQNINVPKIHLLIGNRLTQFEGPATAFAALSDATATSLFSIFQNHPEYFTTRSESICNKSDFINEFSLPLRDFNTAGVVCAHLGRKLSSMKQGYYEIYGRNVKVNADKISECIIAIDTIINRL